MKNSGFTLIELLVVIAIIGILTSIVGVFIYNAKNQGNDAGIKQNLVQVRTQAEILAGSGTWSGMYGLTLCPNFPSLACAEGFNDLVVCNGRAGSSVSIFDDPKMVAYLTVLTNLSGPNVKCIARADKWAMSAPLRTFPAESWCVDYLGAGKKGNINGSTASCN